MLHILPPPRAPNPPSPWESILCSTEATDSQHNIETSSWESSTKFNKNSRRHPFRTRLRNLGIHINIQDSSTGIEGDEVDTGRTSKSLSECYFAGKGTALVLPAEAQKSSRQTETEGNNIQKHLQSMFYLLRPEETLKMAVKLESVHPSRTRYLVVVSRMGRRAEESCLLGIDCNEKTTVGLVLRVLADTAITLDGDGGFSVSVCGRHHIFKPVSVQAMWSALQTLHKASSKAREENYFQGGLSHDWVDYYERRIESDRSCLNEWHAMDDLESRRPPSPDSIRTKPRERDETEKVIRSTLKEIMMSVDLDEVTSKYIRNRLEEELDMDLGEYKSFIDQEMLTILGQMDAPTEIFDHVYLGSEWNASNYEELKRNGVRHILNVTREIDNFFPGTFDYLNIRVYDDEKTDLLKYWDNTYKYITKARKEGSKVLVHCKMGVSRSASVVIAYAMKAYNWDFQTAMQHVKEKRTCIKPNTSFVAQLETYQGILDAMKNKEKLQRSKSETNLKFPGDKSERTLPGSQPTPLLQALSRRAVLQSTMSGQDLRSVGDRPKSWSPDVTTTNELMSGLLTPFRSLENINRKSLSKESLGSLRRHKSVTKLHHKDHRNVLLPCDNGESYSVSPNQIRHLPGQIQDEKTPTTVKQMVNEYESQNDSINKDSRKKLVLNLVDDSKTSSNPSYNVDSSFYIVSEEDGLVAQTKQPTQPMLRAVLVKKEIWDPGEKNPSQVSFYCNSSTDKACDLKCSVNSEGGEQTMWTSSTVLQTIDTINKVPDRPNKTFRKDGDPFSNHLDRVFDREERKQQRVSTVPPVPSNITDVSNEHPTRDCPSRQSSWGSYDSAVVLSFQGDVRDAPSRHSSWGSGDTRTLPSRNSSWGSYDMRPGGPVHHYINENGEKVMHSNDEASWYPGTVKRTKRRLEEKMETKKENDEFLFVSDSSVQCSRSVSSETLHSENPVSVVSENEGTTEAFNIKLIQDTEDVLVKNSSSAISAEIDIVNIKKGNVNVFTSSCLSVSAPESSSMEMIPQACSLSRSTSNVSFTGKMNKEISNLNVINVAQQCFSVKQHKHFIENMNKYSNTNNKKLEAPPEREHNGGIVQNLKKEFEAKTSSGTNVEKSNHSLAMDVAQNESSKHKSLPSSPHSVHVEKDKCDLNRTNSDPGEDLSFKNLIGKFELNTKENQNAQVTLRPRIFASKRNNRFSCIEVSSEKNPLRITQTPLISSFRDKKVENLNNKQPSIVKNQNSNVVVATVIAKAAIKQQQQQYGKTHPLARISIKPRHNNLVYNTM